MESERIYISIKEGTHSPANCFPQIVEVSNEQLNAFIDNVAAYCEPDMALRPQALHTHYTGVVCGGGP